MQSCPFSRIEQRSGSTGLEALFENIKLDRGKINESVCMSLLHTSNNRAHGLFLLVMQQRPELLRKTRCPLCKREANLKWEPRYNGFKGICFNCVISWVDRKIKPRLK